MNREALTAVQVDYSVGIIKGRLVCRYTILGKDSYLDLGKLTWMERFVKLVSGIIPDRCMQELRDEVRKSIMSLPREERTQLIDTAGERPWHTSSAFPAKPSSR